MAFWNAPIDDVDHKLNTVKVRSSDVRSFR